MYISKYVSIRGCFSTPKGVRKQKRLGNTELAHKYYFQMFTILAALTNLAVYEPHTSWFDLHTIAYKDPSKTKRPH